MTTSTWDDESREFTLSVDSSGAITAADSRASRMLGAPLDAPFASLALPGTESKAAALLAQASRQAVANWELSLAMHDGAATAIFSGRPDGHGGAHLLGLRLPDGYGESLRQLNDSMSDVVSLNREIPRQKREALDRNERLRVAYEHLDESSRGIRSLHSELADKADTLRRTSEVKSRLVANVSHELRTPLHSILGLAKLLLSGADGPLTPEQQKQITFIRSSAEELSQLVTDMLDLARTEAGKLQLRPESFSVSEFFSALRGTIRPLMPADGPVGVQIGTPEQDIRLNTDQGKLAQIVRNLVSNALKFTEKGGVRVSARDAGDSVAFEVSDTGIGIASEHFDRIFEEFGQIDSHVQRRVQGSGLGLPLSRRLAEVLGGTLTVDSTLGAGSTFTLTVPKVHLEVSEIERLQTRPLDPGKAPVLVVEDDRKTIFLYEKYLSMAGFQVMPARTIAEARDLVATRPSAIVLDIMLENETSWDFLAQLKNDPNTRDIPVLVVTVTSKAQKARALGADEFWLKPIDQEQLIRKLRSLTRSGSSPVKLLVIDDDERARYLVRKLLEGTPYELSEASNGPDGIRAAQEERPNVILLDFLLRDTTAFDVLDELKADPRTRAIPVVIITSHLLDPHERRRLSEETEAILSKDNLSRELALNRIRDALRKSNVERGHGG